MEGSFRIVTIKGIPIRVHFSFLLVLPLLALLFGRVFVEAARVAGVPAEQLVGTPFAWGLLLAVALFCSVLIHELSHALYARAKGGRVKDITLLMIGGVTQMAEPPREVRDEAWMAAVGPLTSLLLGGGLYGLHLLARLDSFNASFALFYLGSLNVFLGLFNLLPAFPMDGGRVLRAVLASRIGILRATRAAVNVGKGFAIVFGALGFLSFNFFLLLIAFFVYAGATAEGRQVMMRAVLGDLRVRDLMTPGPVALEATETLDQAASRMRAERRVAFPVVSGPSPVGILTLKRLSAVEPSRWAMVTVREVAQAAEPLAAEADAWSAFRRMAESGLPELPVVEEGRLAGVLSQEDLARGIELYELGRRPGERWPYGRRPVRA